VFEVSELTDWERQRLSALEQQLSAEDPQLAARLAGPAPARRSRVMARIGWAMIWVGAVLLLCGGLLRDGSSTVLALLLLAGGPTTVWHARDAARRLRS
jgi:hypothetical protein